MATLREWIARLWATARPTGVMAIWSRNYRHFGNMRKARRVPTAAADRAAALETGGIAQVMELLRDQAFNLGI